MEKPASSKRLLTIDFLRGVASLGVAFFHAYGLGIFHKGDPVVYSAFDQVMAYLVSFGFTGVFLFFVISGFCIHLRWVKAKLKGDHGALDFIPFWKRRIRRLYPAYLVALLLYIALQYYAGQLQFTSFFFYDLGSHLLMLHNLDIRTVYSLNGVFWTLAIEEQLYIAYFLLVWLRKKYGWNITLLITLAVRFAWMAIAFVVARTTGVTLPVSESALTVWFIWALGSVAVEAHYGIIQLPRYLKSYLVGFSFLAAAAVLHSVGSFSGAGSVYIRIAYVATQPLWGIGFFCVVNAFVRSELALAGNWRPVVKFFAWIGLFSYSLYLTHELILQFVQNVAPMIKILMSLLLAWLFYLVLEKPFMNLPKKNLA